MKLLNRTALITGANQGLGAELALRFRREGADVAICARNESLLAGMVERLCAVEAPGKVFARRADVAREADVDAWVAEAVAALGRIDILVNCAGVLGPRGTTDEMDWAEWKRAIEINLFGTVYVCRVVAPHMKAAKGGKIINLSGGGATKPMPSLSAYGASKAGVVRFTETLALELQPWNVDVNAVAPGMLYTRLATDAVDVGEAALGKGYFVELEKQKANPQPAFDRAADLCVFLASSESDGVTGRLLSAAWDPWASLPARKAELAKSDVYTLRRIVPGDRGLDWERKA